MERNARNDVARTAKEQTQVQLVPSFSFFFVRTYDMGNCVKIGS